jgi:hypothetical protein
VQPSRLRQSIFVSRKGIAAATLLFAATALLFAATTLLLTGTAHSDEPAETKSVNQPVEAKWSDLVGKWASIEFGGEGEVEIDEKLIKLGMGSPMTGVRWNGKVPRENYELTLEARRTEGLDFFCGLTFPVGKDHVSFVLGGWGGGVVGISSIDGYDASENDTTMYQQFKIKQWYKVRVQVNEGAIKCWIDEKIAVDQQREGHTFDIRFEMDESTPLGISSFQCKSELRNLRVRNLTPAEIKKAAAELDDSPAARGTGQ